jgi:hypothetical protein
LHDGKADIIRRLADFRLEGYFQGQKSRSETQKATIFQALHLKYQMGQAPPRLPKNGAEEWPEKAGEPHENGSPE